MNILEFIVARVCTEYEKNINVLDYVSPSDENQDFRALTVLQLIADQGESLVEPRVILPILKRVNLTFRQKCGKALTISEVRVHHLPFYLATQILLRKDRRIDGYPFVPFVNHKNSDIRVQSYYSLWLSKKCLLEKGVIPLLLDNIAESLFFNDAALGIVMRICANKPELIEFVRTYEPRAGITEEYKNAISDFSRKSREFVGAGGFFGLELRMRDWLFKMLAGIKLKE